MYCKVSFFIRKEVNVPFQNYTLYILRKSKLEDRIFSKTRRE